MLTTLPAAVPSRPRSATRLRLAQAAASPRPHYELRANMDPQQGLSLSIWQLPSLAAPLLEEPRCVASLKGRPYRLLESRLLKRLAAQGHAVAGLRPGQKCVAAVEEPEAVRLALLFRILAPMRSIDRIESVADGIDRLSLEEASYWLGMSLHRSQPRRVLAALRMLLTMS